MQRRTERLCDWATGDRLFIPASEWPHKLDQSAERCQHHFHKQAHYIGSCTKAGYPVRTQSTMGDFVLTLHPTRETPNIEQGVVWVTRRAAPVASARIAPVLIGRAFALLFKTPEGIYEKQPIWQRLPCPCGARL